MKFEIGCQKMPQTPIVQTKNLTKYYGKHLGIRDVNLEIYPQEIFGFLGPNGAGKTTTIRILLDLIRPTSGTATIFGLDSHKEIERIHEKIAYIPGELEFNKNWTGQRTIKHMLNLYSHVAKDSLIENLAQTLKVDLSKKVKELSKGNKQKIGVILALAPDVELLVLDEPTSGLDPLIKNEFYKLLSEKQAQNNCTVFLSSHILSEVEKVANRVAIVNNGSITQVATLNQLQQLALKNLEIEFPTQDQAKKNLNKIPEKAAKNLTQQANTLNLLCSREDLHSVLSWLKDTNFKDLNVRNPSLEDIFLEYYRVQPYEKNANNNKRGEN
jgi:ABC-2 type transport system ATP-binding protein